MYTCKHCGCEYDLKPRFCPGCGSYFIDADDATDGYEWKGVIRADGTISSNVKVQKKRGSGQDYSADMTTGQRVWGILGIIFAAHALMFSVFAGLIDTSFIILVVPNFILGIIGARNTFGAMRRVSYILILLSVILFLLSLFIRQL